jgi:hypothetical protein
MKCVVLFLLIIQSLPLFARDREILKCLGTEEKRFHQSKKMGPTYDLNQRLMSEMLQIPDVDLEPSVYAEICQQKNSSESLLLLQHSIYEGRKIFKIREGAQKLTTEGMIEDYLEATREIFLNFLSAIQTISPTPTCLNEEIPVLGKFFTDVKYLQEDVDIKQVFKDRDKEIFRELRRYPRAFSACKARLKKKAKSASKAPAKKS